MGGGQRFVLAKEFNGAPKTENFRLEKYELADLKENEFLCAAEYLTVDPYMRLRNSNVNEVLVGGQIAKIIQSKHEKFPENSYICGMLGWQTHTIVNPDNLPKVGGSTHLYILPDIGDLPRSLGLGSLGMPGCTAYFGFLEICQPKAGETVVVTTAAGAVGSLVGQIAKLKGCHVIGLAGTDEKCAWIKNELGFDHALNYKTVNIAESLKAAAPNGVDCYFDNVGGDISSIIISQMNDFGRISVCGCISAYNSNPDCMPKAHILQPSFVWKQLKMEGFLVYRWAERYSEAIQQMIIWINEGKIKYRETVTEDFANMPEAFMQMLNGENIGKAIVKV